MNCLQIARILEYQIQISPSGFELLRIGETLVGVRKHVLPGNQYPTSEFLFRLYALERKAYFYTNIKDWEHINHVVRSLCLLDGIEIRDTYYRK